MRTIKHPALEGESIQPITWALLLAVVLLAIGQIGLGVYLNHRQQIRDARDELERQGVCAILDRFPVGNTSLDTARTDYRCGLPRPPKVPLGPTPQPTVIVRPRPTVTATVTAPGPTRFVVTPGPTVTITKRPPPKHHRPKPEPRPSPSHTRLIPSPVCIPKPTVPL